MSDFPGSAFGLGEVVSWAAMQRRLILLFLLTGVGLGVLSYPWVSVLEISTVGTGHVLWCSPDGDG